MLKILKNSLERKSNLTFNIEIGKYYFNIMLLNSKLVTSI